MRSQRLLLPTPAHAIHSYALTHLCRQAINDMFEVWLLYISPPPSSSSGRVPSLATSPSAVLSYSTLALPASEPALEPAPDTDMLGSTAIISARMSRMGFIQC